MLRKLFQAKPKWPFEPDFFLSTAGESGHLLEPVACKVLDVLVGWNRSDYVLVQVSSPVTHGERTLDSLVLSTRHQGCSLAPLNESPAFVYICCEKVDRFSVGEMVTLERLDFFAKGQVFKSYDDAAKDRDVWLPAHQDS